MADDRHANRNETQVRVPEVLRPLRSLLAVVAHPDDESFGLGGVLAALAATGRRVSLLCFTAGEGSTLGASPSWPEPGPLSWAPQPGPSASASIGRPRRDCRRWNGAFLLVSPMPLPLASAWKSTAWPTANCSPSRSTGACAGKAIAAHVSQGHDHPLLRRRSELLGGGAHPVQHCLEPPRQ